MMTLAISLLLQATDTVALPINLRPLEIYELADYSDFAQVSPGFTVSRSADRTFKTRASDLQLPTLVVNSGNNHLVIVENLRFPCLTQYMTPQGFDYFSTSTANNQTFIAIGRRPLQDTLAFFEGPGRGLQDTDHGLPKDSLRTMALNPNEFAVLALFPTTRTHITKPAHHEYAALDIAAQALSPDSLASVESTTRFLAQINTSGFKFNTPAAQQFIAKLRALDDASLSSYTRARIHGVRVHFGDLSAETSFFESVVASDNELSGIWSSPEPDWFFSSALVNDLVPWPPQFDDFIKYNKERVGRMLAAATQTSKPKIRKAILYRTGSQFQASFTQYLPKLLDNCINNKEYADQLLLLLPKWTNRPDLDPKTTNLTKAELIARWRELYPPLSP